MFKGIVRFLRRLSYVAPQDGLYAINSVLWDSIYEIRGKCSGVHVTHSSLKNLKQNIEEHIKFVNEKYPNKCVRTHIYQLRDITYTINIELLRKGNYDK